MDQRGVFFKAPFLKTPPLIQESDPETAKTTEQLVHIQNVPPQRGKEGRKRRYGKEREGREGEKRKRREM